MTDTTHLTALITRLANEKENLRIAKSDAERALRSVWVAQIEREIRDEEVFLGMEPVVEMTDAKLLEELGF